MEKKHHSLVLVVCQPFNKFQSHLHFVSYVCSCCTFGDHRQYVDWDGDGVPRPQHIE